MYSILVYAAIAAALFGLGYLKGSESRNAEVAHLVAAIQTATNKAKELMDRDPIIQKEIVVQYRDRIVKVKEVEPELQSQVEVIRAKHPDCVLPAEFRLLHDTAASGDSPPDPAPGVDGPAEVPCDVAAEIIARNYTAARENAEQLKSLQEWVTRTQWNTSPESSSSSSEPSASR